MVVGDFHAIVNAQEKTGRRAPKHISCIEFQKMIDECALIDVGYSGSRYTWANNRQVGGYVAARIDRCNMFAAWLQALPDTKVQHLTRLESDHAPLNIRCKIENKRSSSFKYEQMWATHPSFLEAVRLSFHAPCLGNPQYIFHTKLGRLRNRLKQWNKEVFGHLHWFIEQAEKELIEAQYQLDSQETDTAMEEFWQAKDKLTVALNQEETHARQQSRLPWIKEGDRNTAFFHHKAQIHGIFNMIQSMQTEDGLLEEEKEVDDFLVQHFTSLHNETTNLQEDTPTIINNMPQLNTENCHPAFQAMPHEHEIKETVFSLHKDSAPGPDGFTGAFSQTGDWTP